MKHWFAPGDIEVELDRAATPPQPEDAYDRLPTPIRSVVSKTEYLWLTEREKASLTEDLCTPEW